MNALKRKPTFEEVVQDAELPPFRVKLPDRYPTFLAESPALAVLDEDLNEQQKRVAEEAAREAEILRVAQETGAPQSLIRQLKQPPQTNLYIGDNDAQIARAMQLELDDESQSLNRAVMRYRNTAQMEQQVDRNLTVAHRGNALRSLESTVRYYIGDDDFQDAQDFVPNLYTPDVPTEIPWDEAFSEAELRYMQEYDLGTLGSLAQNVGRGLGQGVRAFAPLVGAVGGAVGSSLGQVGTATAYALPAASAAASVLPAAARGAASTLRGSVRHTSQAVRGVSSAMQRLNDLGMPLERRARLVDGMSVSQSFGHFVNNHRL
jgi:hypothetical protein